jgi:gluconate kinase
VSLSYVTGVSGTGKSTICRELRARGFVAYDVDEHVFASWVNRSTGQVDPFPAPAPGFDIHDWYAKHRWVLDADKIKALKDESDRTPTNAFLCGTAEGDDVVWPSFDEVFALTIDDATIRERISTRTDNTFGRTPAELAEILSWNAQFAASHRRFGAILIDATRPVDRVVDEILSHVAS